MQISFATNISSRQLATFSFTLLPAVFYAFFVCSAAGKSLRFAFRWVQLQLPFYLRFNFASWTKPFFGMHLLQNLFRRKYSCCSCQIDTRSFWYIWKGILKEKPKKFFDTNYDQLKFILVKARVDGKITWDDIGSIAYLLAQFHKSKHRPVTECFIKLFREPYYLGSEWQ